MPSLGKLIKLKLEADSLGEEIDSLGIKINSIVLQVQQLRVEIHSSNPEMKREAAMEKENREEVQALAPNIPEDEGQEVDFDLPPKFDEYQPEEGDILVLNSTWNELEEEVVETIEGETLTLAIHHPSHPIKPIPFTPVQDQSYSDPKLAHLAPPKKNPNPSHVHLFSIPLHPILKQFPRDQKRETIFKTKPRLFDWLILFQPSLVFLILILGQ
jgi:hypothetical protein